MSRHYDESEVNSNELWNEPNEKQTLITLFVNVDLLIAIFIFSSFLCFSFTFKNVYCVDDALINAFSRLKFYNLLFFEEWFDYTDYRSVMFFFTLFCVTDCFQFCLPNLVSRIWLWEKTKIKEKKKNNTYKLH